MAKRAMQLWAYCKKWLLLELSTKSLWAFAKSLGHMPVLFFFFFGVRPFCRPARHWLDESVWLSLDMLNVFFGGAPEVASALLARVNHQVLNSPFVGTPYIFFPFVETAVKALSKVAVSTWLIKHEATCYDLNLQPAKISSTSTPNWRMLSVFAFRYLLLLTIRRADRYPLVLPPTRTKKEKKNVQNRI